MVLENTDQNLFLQSGNMFKYIIEFEQMLAEGIKNKTFQKAELVSVRGSRLGKTKFGILLGFTIDSSEEFVIDYYGYFKRSRGFNSRIQILKKETPGKQIKAIQVTAIHFASIRIEQIAKLDSSLVEGFPKFKSFILDKRGFKKSA